MLLNGKLPFVLNAGLHNPLLAPRSSFRLDRVAMRVCHVAELRPWLGAAKRNDIAVRVVTLRKGCRSRAGSPGVLPACRTEGLHGRDGGADNCNVDLNHGPDVDGNSVIKGVTGAGEFADSIKTDDAIFYSVRGVTDFLLLASTLQLTRIHRKKHQHQRRRTKSTSLFLAV